MFKYEKCLIVKCFSSALCHYFIIFANSTFLCRFCRFCFLVQIPVFAPILPSSTNFYVISCRSMKISTFLCRFHIWCRFHFFLQIQLFVQIPLFVQILLFCADSTFHCGSHCCSKLSSASVENTENTLNIIIIIVCKNKFNLFILTN